MTPPPSKLPPPKEPPKLYPHIVPWSIYPIMMPYPQQKLNTGRLSVNNAFAGSQMNLLAKNAQNARKRHIYLQERGGSVSPNFTPANFAAARLSATSVDACTPAAAASKKKKPPPVAAHPLATSLSTTTAEKPMPSSITLRSQLQPGESPLLEKQHAAPMNKKNLIALAFTSIMSLDHLREKWLPAPGIICIIKKRYKFEGDMDFDEMRFNKAISKYTVNCVDIQGPLNQTGIFRIQRDVTNCSILNQMLDSNSEKRHVYLYYVTDPGKSMGALPLTHNALVPQYKEEPVEETAAEETASQNSGERPKRKANRPVMDWITSGGSNTKDDSKAKPEDEQPKKLLHEELKKLRKEQWEKLYQQAQETCDKELERRNSKRTRVRDTVDEELERIAQLQVNIDLEKKALERAKQEKASHLKKMEELKLTSYFDSPEAKSLFRPKEDETVIECLKRRILLLSEAINDSNGYTRIVIEPPKEDGDKPLDEPTLFRRQQITCHALYLRLAYIKVLEKMDKCETWSQCCQKAIDELKYSTSISSIGNPQIIGRLNSVFREHEKFAAPKPKNQSRKGMKYAKKAKTEKESTTTGDDNGGGEHMAAPSDGHGTEPLNANAELVAATDLQAMRAAVQAQMPPSVQYDWTYDNRFHTV